MISTHRGEKCNEGVREEYFLNLSDSAEFASRLAPLAEVDKLDGARVSAQVKSQSKGKPCDQGINDIPSGLLPSSQHTLTGSNNYCNSPPLPCLVYT